MNHELAKTLTTALVQFIDRERTECTMCCSNEEWESLEYHIRNNHFDDVEAFLQNKLAGLTEFEQALSNYLKNDFEYFHTQKWDEQKWDDVIRTQSKELLALAKKQLLSYADESNPAIEAMADLERNFKCDPAKLPGWLIDELNKAFKRGQESSHEDYIRGYTNGYKDAEKQYNESVAYHPPIMPTYPANWGCDGTHCTNPQMDCINCPRRTTGGSPYWDRHPLRKRTSTGDRTGNASVTAEGSRP